MKTRRLTLAIFFQPRSLLFMFIVGHFQDAMVSLGMTDVSEA